MTLKASLPKLGIQMTAPMIKLTLCTLIDSFPQQTDLRTTLSKTQLSRIGDITDVSTLREFRIRERPEARGPVKKCSGKTSQGLSC